MFEHIRIRSRKSGGMPTKASGEKPQAGAERTRLSLDNEPLSRTEAESPEVTVRERGPGVTTFGDVLRRGSQSFLEVHTLFNQRVGTSDRFLYRRLIPHLFRLHRESISIVLPIGRALDTIETETVFVVDDLIDLQEAYDQLTSTLSEAEREFLRSWSEVKRRERKSFDVESLVAKRRHGRPPSPKILGSIKDKMAQVFQRQLSGLFRPMGITLYSNQDLAASAHFLERIYSHLVRRELSFEGCFVILVDLLGPLGGRLEDVLRWLIRDGNELGATVWLHCSLTSMPEPLLAQFGNYVIFRPSTVEVDLLTRVLPSPSQDIDPQQYRQKILMYGPCVGTGKWEIFG
jgi:hypothetical protein